jgi:hypothetical protein
VVGQNDDGRQFVVNSGMCHAAADALAGALRDQSTDDEIEAGWNYLPLPSKQSRPSMARPMPEPTKEPATKPGPKGCGAPMSSGYARCGSHNPSGIASLCRACAYRRDGETAVRNRFAKKQRWSLKQRQKHIGAAETKPRSWRRPVP